MEQDGALTIKALTGLDNKNFLFSFGMCLRPSLQAALEYLMSSGRYDGREDFAVVVQPFFRYPLVPLVGVGSPHIYLNTHNIIRHNLFSNGLISPRLLKDTSAMNHSIAQLFRVNKCRTNKFDTNSEPAPITK